MKIEFKLIPFPHIIIDDFFNETQLIAVWREILHLYPKMAPPQVTGTARDFHGVPLKKNIGVFIDDVYGRNTANSLLYSSIATHTKIIFSNEFKRNLQTNANHPDGLYFRLFRDINPEKTVATLLQLYQNGDYYKPHHDTFAFTGVIVLHSEEKKYDGGEFFFPEYDHIINIKNNQMVIFPSVINHGVKEVKMESNNPEDGRFSITLLMSLDQYKHD